MDRASEDDPGSEPKDNSQDDSARGSDPCAPSADVVEAALAQALQGAVAAGRFDVVAQLAKELEARRLARSANVVTLDTRRARRGV